MSHEQCSLSLSRVIVQVENTSSIGGFKLEKITIEAIKMAVGDIFNSHTDFFFQFRNNHMIYGCNHQVFFFKKHHGFPLLNNHMKNLAGFSKIWLPVFYYTGSLRLKNAWF